MKYIFYAIVLYAIFQGLTYVLSMFDMANKCGALEFCK